MKTDELYININYRKIHLDNEEYNRILNGDQTDLVLDFDDLVLIKDTIKDKQLLVVYNADDNNELPFIADIESINVDDSAGVVKVTLHVITEAEAMYSH